MSLAGSLGVNPPPTVLSTLLQQYPLGPAPMPERPVPPVPQAQPVAAAFGPGAAATREASDAWRFLLGRGLLSPVPALALSARASSVRLHPYFTGSAHRLEPTSAASVSSIPLTDPDLPGGAMHGDSGATLYAEQTQLDDGVEVRCTMPAAEDGV